MKLPVFKAFFATFSYVVVHFLTLLKILWLPMLGVMAVTAYLTPAMIDAQLSMAAAEGMNDDAMVLGTMGQVLKTTGMLYLAMAIFYPMMIAGVLRHVVRGDAPGLPFYLSYGADEFRILGAFILYIVMLMLAYFVGALGLIVIGVVASMLSQAIGGILIGVLAIAFVIALVWFMLRMSLIFPASIGERKIGIAHSWAVTKGSAWSLFFFWFLIFIVVFAFIAVYIGVAASDYFPIFQEMLASANDPAAIEELEQRMMQMQRDMWDMSRPGFWVYIAASYLFSIVYNAIWNVASGVAYRYLTGGQRSA